MATTKTLRLQRRFGTKTEEKNQTKYESLSFGERSKWARSLVRTNEAKSLKEAWAIIKNK